MSSVRTVTQTKQKIFKIPVKILKDESIEHSDLSIQEQKGAYDEKFDANNNDEEPPIKIEHKMQIVWFNAIGFLILHLAALYGAYLSLTSAKILTILWATVLAYTAALSVTMGAHRLYTHKTFKANKWIRAALVTFQTVAGQNCLWVWIRDHRQHHKYSDTDADPHNASRGFFFSHVGWLMVRKHPDVIKKGKLIDMSDIEQDTIVMFQKKYYKTLFIIFAITLPTVIPYYLWNETLWNSFFISFIARLIVTLNFTWLVNSAAHIYGTRPFSKDIAPAENWFVSFWGLGEGWHNYHHTFPWDYRAAEYGQHFNITTSVIDYCAKKGWVYDIKYATTDLVRKHTIKKGDGTHSLYGKLLSKDLWINDY